MLVGSAHTFIYVDTSRPKIVRAAHKNRRRRRCEGVPIINSNRCRCRCRRSFVPIEHPSVMVATSSLVLKYTYVSVCVCVFESFSPHESIDSTRLDSYSSQPLPLGHALYIVQTTMCTATRRNSATSPKHSANWRCRGSGSSA